MRKRRLAVILLGVLAAAGCGSTGTAGTTSAGGGGAGSCKIALLLPENTTPHYESADKPYFEAEVAKLAPQCKMLYFNAANDGSLQTQQANTALAEGAKVMVLDSADPLSGAAIVQAALAKGVKTIAYDRMTGGPLALLATFNAIQVGNLQGTALVNAMRRAGDRPGSKVVMINGDISGYEAKLPGSASPPCTRTWRCATTSTWSATCSSARRSCAAGHCGRSASPTGCR